MTNQQIIKSTQKFVRTKMEGESTGHDWWHIVRVVHNAKAIAVKEGGNLLIIELAALLHDIADWKFNNDDSTVGAKLSRTFLNKLDVPDNVVDEVAYIVEHISYKGGTNSKRMRSLEGKIVQDADRLDALGAIGIARTFAYGGAAGREIYNPNVGPKEYGSFESYKDSLAENHTIKHFYEKLFLLKDKMNTKTGRNMAQNRHKFMENYLKQFYAEWSSEK